MVWMRRPITTSSVKNIWAAENLDSVEAEVGPYKLYVYSFQTLRERNWLVDEEPVHLMSAVIATAMFTGQTSRLGKMTFPTEELSLCPININKHWILVIIMKSKKVLIVMDQLGNKLSYHSMLHDNWSRFLRMNKPEDQGANWYTWVMEHSSQQDSSSSGVLILMFAKEFLKMKTINAVRTSAEAVMDAHLEIACKLLQYST
ncbi:uncharacterized protein LOC143987071 [Lithobates pipiens]